jgi:hypothetical protein
MFRRCDAAYTYPLADAEGNARMGTKLTDVVLFARRSSTSLTRSRSPYQPWYLSAGDF